MSQETPTTNTAPAELHSAVGLSFVKNRSSAGLTPEWRTEAHD